MASIITDSYEFFVNTTLEAQWEDTLPYPTTRKIYRHESNEGSVIEFDMFGKKVKLFVADAKYRAVKPWGTYGIDVRELKHFGNDWGTDHEIQGPWTGWGIDLRTNPLRYIPDDDELSRYFDKLREAETAKEGTDILMKYSGADSAHYCRSQTISNIGALDLPNAYECIIIYAEADNLDVLDPTTASYPNYALGYKTRSRFNFNGKFFMESCNLYSATNELGVTQYGRVDQSFFTVNEPYGVAPVKEL